MKEYDVAPGKWTKIESRYCCTAMGEAVAGNFVTLSEYTSDGLQFSMISTCAITDDGEYSPPLFKVIIYCPWCGEKISG